MAVTQSVAENAKAVVRLRGKAPLFLSNCLVQLKNLHLHLEDGGFKEGLLVGANHLPFCGKMITTVLLICSTLSH